VVCCHNIPHVCICLRDLNISQLLLKHNLGSTSKYVGTSLAATFFMTACNMLVWASRFAFRFKISGKLSMASDKSFPPFIAASAPSDADHTVLILYDRTKSWPIITGVIPLPLSYRPGLDRISISFSDTSASSFSLASMASGKMAQAYLQ